MKKKIAKLSIQILISGFFLWLAFRHVVWSDIITAFSQIDVKYVIIGTVLHSSSFFIRASRWQYLLSPVKKISYASSYQVMTISYAANNLIPLRAGDILRAVLIGNKEKISKVASFSSVILERVVDGLTMLIFLIIGFANLHTESLWLTRVMYLSILVFFTCIVFIVLLCKYQQSFIHFLGRMISKKSEKLADAAIRFMQNFLVAFQVVQSKSMLVKILVSSLLIWGLEASLFMMVAKSFGISDHVFLLGIVSVAIVSLGIMIPSSPGYVGTFEFFCTLSLGLFMIHSSQSASFSILVHVSQYIPITVIGCIMWLSLTLSNKSSRQRIETIKDESV
ncbi:MAG TPA: lysylphosphatidylglycerol synthase transmembrane domain-containing protein [Paenibacillus sp.]|jgi:hypothetical protein